MGYELYTVGHSTHPQGVFTDLLKNAGVTLLVDIRTGPGSRRYPWFGRDLMAEWLPDAGIAYHWAQDLGGFRKTRDDSPNTALRHPSFRGYADYMLTGLFHQSAVDLAFHTRMAGVQVALMCSEAVWWRCHRRLVSDYMTLVLDQPVKHLMSNGNLYEHKVTEGASLHGDHLIYDDGQSPLSLVNSTTTP